MTLRSAAAAARQLLHADWPEGSPGQAGRHWPTVDSGHAEASIGSGAGWTGVRLTSLFDSAMRSSRDTCARPSGAGAGCAVRCGPREPNAAPSRHANMDFPRGPVMDEQGREGGREGRVRGHAA